MVNQIHYKGHILYQYDDLYYSIYNNDGEEEIFTREDHKLTVDECKDKISAYVEHKKKFRFRRGL